MKPIQKLNADYSYTSKFFYFFVKSMKEKYPIDYLIRVKLLMSIGVMN